MKRIRFFSGLLGERTALAILLLLSSSLIAGSSSHALSSIRSWKATKDIDIFDASEKQYIGFVKSIWCRGREFLVASFSLLNRWRCFELKSNGMYPAFFLSVLLTSSDSSKDSSLKLGILVLKKPNEFKNFRNANRLVGGGISRNFGSYIPEY